MKNIMFWKITVGLLSSGRIIWFLGFGVSLLKSPPNQEPLFEDFFSIGFSEAFLVEATGFEAGFGVSRASNSSNGSYCFLVDGVIEIVGCDDWNKVYNSSSQSCSSKVDHCLLQ